MNANASGQNFDNDDFQHLGMLRKGDCAIVSGLASCTDKKQLAVKNRLLELGFVPGEKIRVVAESFPHRDPIAVRLGNSTFALRRFEASMIGVVCTLRDAA